MWGSRGKQQDGVSQEGEQAEDAFVFQAGFGATSFLARYHRGR